MDCPRCGASLVAYSLQNQTERVCEECGYVGLTTTHTVPAKTEISESWDEVLDRFTERSAKTDFEVMTHRSREPPTPQEIEAEEDDTTGDDTDGVTTLALAERTRRSRRIHLPTDSDDDEE